MSFLLLIVIARAQKKPIQQQIDATSPNRFSTEKLFSTKLVASDRATTLREYVSKFTLLEVDNIALNRVASTKPPALEIDIPINGTTATLQLIESKVVNGQTVFTSQNNSRKEIVQYNQGAYYYGVIKNQPNTIVAISFFNNCIIGVISNEKGNYVLGKSNTKDNQSNEYIIYNDRDLLIKNTFICGTTDNLLDIPTLPSASTSLTGANKCIRVYIETDYQIFLNQSSNISNVLNFVTGLFNVTRTIYQNESINTSISEVKVWTSTSGYDTANNPSQTLYVLSNNVIGGFNGDLAHVFSGKSLGGGIAYLNTLCRDNANRTAASTGLGTSTPSFPTYSWNAEVVTHEMGHNLGSPHTHACYWNGTNTAIDGCGPTYGATYSPPITYEGSCSGAPIPTSGGTIMSYCHLGTAGINFTLGFGSQPGDTIRKRINSAVCLSACCPMDVIITGSYSNLLTESETWIKSSGKTTILNTATVKLDANPTNGYIELNPTDDTSFFLAAPTSGVFVAQALDGCSASIPTFTASRTAFAKTIIADRNDLPTTTESGIKVYPNPTTESFTVIANYDLKDIRMEMFDISGRIQRIAINDIDKRSKKITFGKISTGTYILVLYAGKEKDAKKEAVKIVIQ